MSCLPFIDLGKIFRSQKEHICNGISGNILFIMFFHIAFDLICQRKGPVDLIFVLQST